MHGPYFGKDKDAARYCGMGHSTFQKFKKLYDIPRDAGPSRKQYAASRLDEWMENPDNFLIVQVQKQTSQRLTLDDLGG